MKWIECEYLVVIVNYRTPLDVVGCLRSLASEVEFVGDVKVVVVDNFSEDGSVEIISGFIEREGWRSWVKVISSGRNGGFSYGNNVAIKLSLASDRPAKVFHLLNPDTEVRPNSLKAIKLFFAAHEGVGIVGSRQVTESGDWNKAFRFPGIASEFSRAVNLGLISRTLSAYEVARNMGDKPEQVDWVSGASMAIRREVIDSVGLMDENFFLYYEETDFCLNASRAGWQTWHVSDSVVFHKVGRSTGVTSEKSRNKGRLPSYVYESRAYFFAKNFGKTYAVLTDFSYLLGCTIGKLVCLITPKENNLNDGTVRDTLKFGVLRFFQ